MWFIRIRTGVSVLVHAVLATDKSDLEGIQNEVVPPVFLSRKEAEAAEGFLRSFVDRFLDVRRRVTREGRMALFVVSPTNRVGLVSVSYSECTYENSRSVRYENDLIVAAVGRVELDVPSPFPLHITEALKYATELDLKVRSYPVSR